MFNKGVKNTATILNTIQQSKTAMAQNFLGLRSTLQQQFNSVESKLILQSERGTTQIINEMMVLEHATTNLIRQSTCDLGRNNYIEDLRDLRVWIFKNGQIPE